MKEKLRKIDWMKVIIMVALLIFWIIVGVCVYKITTNADVEECAFTKCTRNQEEKEEPKSQVLEDPYGKFIRVKTTAYCACSKCCGKWADGGTTASGRKAVEGLTVASNTYYGKGILLYDENMNLIGIYECMDKGTKGIDVYMDSHQRALEFGIHYYYIQVIDAIG